MPLTLVLGPRGSGKTFFTTKINLKSLRPIFSNYWIDHPNYHKLKLHELPFLPIGIELIMDEGYSLVDSRNSMSYINVYISYMAFQLRKTNTNIFVTAQQLDSIEKRYRNEWDYKVECERVPNENQDWRFWDFGYLISDKRKGSSSFWVVFYKDALKIFPKYNTNEIVPPRNISRIVYEFISSDPLMLSDYSRKIAEKIKGNFTGKKITKGSVEYYLKRNKFDKIWKNDVYIELINM